MTKYAKELDDIFFKNKTDKSTVRHGYSEYYAEIINRYGKKNIEVLMEIGIGYDNKYGAPIKSLKSWKEYLPNANIVGLDIVDWTKYSSRGITIYHGSQDDPIIASTIAKNYYRGIDILVDDGAHTNELTEASFDIYFPLVKPGGYYIIEDTHTAYDAVWTPEDLSDKRYNDIEIFNKFILKLINAANINGMYKKDTDFMKLKEAVDATDDTLAKMVGEVTIVRGMIIIKKRKV